MQYDLLEDIYTAIKSRTDWQNRQTTWYRMRHQGLRRAGKPYPNAADLHFPLIDTLIERMKPFYFQQLYATEQLATFVSMRSQPVEATSAVAAWFDYRLKQKTNLEREIMGAIDNMVMSGRAVLKVAWDIGEKYICFDAVDPVYFIVPGQTSELKDAAWCVHVVHLTEAEYKRNKDFRQDSSFIKSIKGQQPASDPSADMKWHEVKRREGLTTAQDPDQIVLWEIHRKSDDGDKIYVDTFSPAKMAEEDAVRSRFTLPYNHGTFISFRTEIKDKGWYSPRGISEIVAAFEDSLCRLWNGKHDCMDYYNKPLFKNTGQLGNTGVTRFLPGSTLPQGVEPVTFPEPPIDFDQEMQSTRALAEYRAGIPDLGATQHLTPGRGSRGDVTATQIQAIVGQSGMSDDMRARVFRLDCADLYRMCWSLYLQYDSKNLLYLLNDEQLTVPMDALHGDYAIMPNGSADSWNKPLQLQKAVARMQMFGGNAFIRQPELVKSVLEVDDPRLIKRLYQDPGQQLADQMEIQAQEISIMLLGFPAAVHQSDDDYAHLQSIQGFVDRRLSTNEEITSEFARLLVQHGGAHDQALMQKKDKRIGQVRQQMAPLIQYLSSVAQRDTPQNIVAGPGATAQAPQAPPGSPAQPTQQQGPADTVKTATGVQDSASKLMNALASLLKAGVQINTAELNKVLAQAGLPPLMAEPVTPPMNAGAGI